jgi:L-ascorbate metabolism protein UlaG (beta-lactamase superfamily)
VKRSRRKFFRWLLAGFGTVAGGGALWGGTSEQRAARWLRRMVVDSKRRIAPAPVKPKPEQWSDNDITICWIGHATVLINFYGIKILTDPAFGHHIGISLVGLGTAGPKRYVAPALRMKELPPIDVVLLSHAHMDHMDLPSLRRLPSSAFTVTAKNTSDLLEGTRLKQIVELPWGERATFRNAKGELAIEAFEVKHWGQRWPSEVERGYNGYVLKREGKAILFGGDTAHTPLFSEVRSRGPFEAAIMPIGAYRPWIWNHCTPEQAVEMANRAGARFIVPVHQQTFRLSDEPLKEPIERLQTALEREPERLALRNVGESFVCPKA